MPLSIHARRALHHLLALDKPGFAMPISSEVCPAEAVPSVRRELAAAGLVYADSEVGALDTTLCLLQGRVAEAGRIDADYEEAEMQWALMQAAEAADPGRYLTDHLPPVLYNNEPMDIEFAREQIAVLMEAGVLNGRRDWEHDLIRAGLTRKGVKLLRAQATPDEEATPPAPAGIQINGDVYGSAITQGSGNTVSIHFRWKIKQVSRDIEDSQLDAEAKRQARELLDEASRCARTEPTKARWCLDQVTAIVVGALGGAAGDGIVTGIAAAADMLAPLL